MADRGSGESGYWYPESAVHPSQPVEVLHALRRFHAADVAMRQRLRTDMGMNETDLRALRHLISAESRGLVIGPKDLTRELGISSAATAKLLARMVDSGHIRRERDLSDRRAQVLYATPEAHREVRKTLAVMHERMLAVAAGLTGEQHGTVIRFLNSLTAVVDPSMPE